MTTTPIAAGPLDVKVSGRCEHSSWVRLFSSPGNAGVGGALLHRERCDDCGRLSFVRDDTGARRIDGDGIGWAPANAGVTGLAPEKDSK
jgi:hypothetical protein